MPYRGKFCRDIDSQFRLFVRGNQHLLLREFARWHSVDTSVTIDGLDAFDYSTARGLIDMQQCLIDCGFIPNIEHLVQAVNQGQYETVKRLVERVDPSGLDNACIRIACYSGHHEIAKLLLQDKRVDPSVDQNQCIVDCTDNGDLEMAKLLLKDPRVDPSDLDDLCLAVACLHRDMWLVRELLKDPRVTPTRRMVQQCQSDLCLDIARLLESDPRLQD
ncbi:hypothetical protein EDD86DRAFT_215122 [Gorgonomyces haynaldii]|nr:hypothetical protein EDD86DRAFT_215122 [Gorgonomyces haynaldii]